MSTSSAGIGRELVELCNAGKSEEAVERFYSERIVSIEGQGSEAMPARMEGLDAVRKKAEWWYENHEIHSLQATGPFCGYRDDQFVVKFDIDVTYKPSDQRIQMSEVGIYTLENDKVIQEEFLYLSP